MSGNNRDKHKVYAVARFLEENHKQRMREVCEECDYEIEFFSDIDEAGGHVSDGDILYCSNPGLLDQMPDLRWCCCANAGVDNFVTTGIFDSGKVLLTNGSGSYGLAISEHIIMMTLMLMRRMPEYTAIMDRGEWRQNLRIRSIYGSRIAIAGTGNLGRTAAKKFRGLVAGSIIGFNRSGRTVDGFDKVYKIDEFADNVSDIDVLVLCLPGTPETEGILSADIIARLPETAYVINVGRGTAIDQDALIDALNNGRLAGAALDVMMPEPLPMDHPLRTARNCILTPHISGDMGLPHTIDVTVDLFCRNLERYVNGEELINLIDPRRGY